MKNILKRSQAAKVAGVSVRQIPKLIEEDGFPAPITVGKSDGWIDTEVQAWIDQKIAERDATLAGGAV
jgi:predicted DNA-binding transcriptional regulator AlpA